MALRLTETTQARLQQWRRVWAARLRDDGGSQSIEMVILVPVALLVLFAAIQVALISWAQSIALTAAQQAATAQRAYDAPGGIGHARAEAFIARTGDGLRDSSITVRAGAERVEVSVSGKALSVLPIFDGFTVTQVAAGPVERFIE